VRWLNVDRVLVMRLQVATDTENVISPSFWGNIMTVVAKLK